MQEINIDGRAWQSSLDFYHDLLQALGSPSWHGDSIDAIIDSIVFGGINSLEPPYIIRIHNTSDLPEDVKLELSTAEQALAEARAEYLERRGTDCGTRFEVVS